MDSPLAEIVKSATVADAAEIGLQIGFSAKAENQPKEKELSLGTARIYQLADAGEISLQLGYDPASR